VKGGFYTISSTERGKKEFINRCNRIKQCKNHSPAIGSRIKDFQHFCSDQSHRRDKKRSFKEELQNTTLEIISYSGYFASGCL